MFQLRFPYLHAWKSKQMHHMKSVNSYFLFPITYFQWNGTFPDPEQHTSNKTTRFSLSYHCLFWFINSLLASFFYLKLQKNSPMIDWQIISVRVFVCVCMCVCVCVCARARARACVCVWCVCECVWLRFFWRHTICINYYT